MTWAEKEGFDRACKDVITRLLQKDECRRLGSQSGASEVKQAKWFVKINWGLLRNMTPPIVPTTGTMNSSRPLRESTSLQLEGARNTDDGLLADEFFGFSSMTLRHDDDEY